MLLAQFQNVDPSHLSNFVLIMAGLLASGAAAGAIYRSFRPTQMPQPLETRVAQEFVLRREIESLQSRHDERVKRLELVVDEIRRDMKRDRDELEASNEERSSRIHQRIDKLQEDIDAKLQRFPHEFMSLLRNAGVIK